MQLDDASDGGTPPQSELLARETRTPQVIRFRDAATLQEISIVGAVHFNDVSMKRATEEVLMAQTRHPELGAVVVELCPFRWEAYIEQAIYDGDFSQASENVICGCLALQRGVPVMLGDTDNEVFLDSAKQVAQQYIFDLFNPLGGGWQSIFDDFKRMLPSIFITKDIAQSELLLDGEAPLSLADYPSFEMLTASLSQIPGRFSAGFGMMSGIMPDVGKVLLSVGVLLAFGLDVTGNGRDNPKPDQYEYAPLIGFASDVCLLGLTVVAMRLLLVPFLEKRNVELARSIRRAARERSAPVVAIMGAAHANMVARLLMSEETFDVNCRSGEGSWVQEQPPPSLMDNLTMP